MEESDLIIRAQAGDEDAFGELVRRHQDRVYRTAARLVGSDDALDVSQEVFVKAFREIRRFRGASALSTWLYRMTVNLSLNHLRSLKREAGRREKYGPGVSQKPPAPDADLEDTEFKERIWAIIDALPERQRTAIILHRFEELSAAETARVMGLSTGAVESLLHRAKSTLLQACRAQGLGPRDTTEDHG